MVTTDPVFKMPSVKQIPVHIDLANEIFQMVSSMIADLDQVAQSLTVAADLDEYSDTPTLNSFTTGRGGGFRGGRGGVRARSGRGRGDRRLATGRGKFCRLCKTAEKDELVFTSHYTASSPSMTERDKYDFITRLAVMGAGVMEDPDIDYVARV